MDSFNTLDKSFHEYLPAVHQKDKDLRDLLRVFAEHFKTIDTLLSTTAQKVNPEISDEHYLRWLASWIDLDLDDDWGKDRKRRHISKAIELYRRRGTKGGLKDFLKIYTGLDAKIEEYYEPGGFQIGVASRIGGVRDVNGAWVEEYELLTPDTKANVHVDVKADAYYIVTQCHGPTVIYDASKVKEVTIGPCDAGNEAKGFTTEPCAPKTAEYPFKITIHIQEAPTEKIGIVEHNNAYIVRRDDLPAPRIVHDRADPCAKYQYVGDTMLKDAVEVPYSIVVELNGPSLEGVVNQLAAERQRLTEAFFAGRSAESRLGAILAHLTDDTHHLMDDIVKSNVPLQPIDRLIAVQAEAAQLAAEIKGQLENSAVKRQLATKPGLFDSSCRRSDKIAQDYVQEVCNRWLMSDEDKKNGEYLTRWRQRQQFTDIFRVHFAEVLLRTLVRARKDETEAAKKKAYLSPAAHIERYLTPDESGGDEPEVIRRARAVLDREKPVHVHYLLHFGEEIIQPLPTMQISIHSTIGVSTVIG